MSIPNKVIDSFSFGLPIITSLKGELENIIKKYNVGYFCDKNSTWEDQILSCINDPIKRKPDIAKAMKILNWQPLVSRKKGLKKAFNYFKSLTLEELNKKDSKFA